MERREEWGDASSGPGEEDEGPPTACPKLEFLTLNFGLALEAKRAHSQADAESDIEIDPEEIVRVFRGRRMIPHGTLNPALYAIQCMMEEGPLRVNRG
jgi:hypothetical protein